MSTRVDGGSRIQECVARELEQTSLCGLAKGPRSASSRAERLETADLTGKPQKSIMGPVKYRPLKQLGSPGLILEPPKNRTGIARIRVAISAQLCIVEKLLDPKSMEIPDTGFLGPKLAEDPRYGKSCGISQLAKTLAMYDRSDPRAARAIIVAGSDFKGTSPKLFKGTSCCLERN